MTSADSRLSGKRILVVEDEYLIADDLAAELRQHGAEVVGPVASLPQAMDLAAGPAPIDVAILDINLREIQAYPLIDQLRARAVQVLIASGYDALAIPERYRDLSRCEKPASPQRVRQAVADLLGEGARLQE